MEYIFEIKFLWWLVYKYLTPQYIFFIKCFYIVFFELQEFWHMSVVLLQLIRQGGLSAQCQDTVLMTLRTYFRQHKNIFFHTSYGYFDTVNWGTLLTFARYVVVTYTPAGRGCWWLNARTLGWGIPRQGVGGKGDVRSPHCATLLNTEMYTFIY